MVKNWTVESERVARVAELEAEVRRLNAALTEIKHKTGRVCPNFEICKHEPCQSSYTAWQIADTALAAAASEETNATT